MTSISDVPLPQRLIKLDFRSRWHFGSGWCTPPPFRIWKVEASSSNFHFPPSQRLIKLDFRSRWHYGSGWSTPPPMIEINMNAIENNWGQQVHFTNLPPPLHSLQTYISSLWNTLKRKPQFFKFNWDFGSTWHCSSGWCTPPFQYDYLILCLNRKLVNYKFKWIWIHGLKPHPPPLSSPKNETLIFGLHSTSDDGQAGRWTWTPSATSLQPKRWNAHFWIMFNFWWLSGLVDGLEPHLPPLSSQKNEMLIFELHSTSDDQLGWLMDLNPVHHPSSTNAHFWIMFNFWWWPGWSLDSNPICHLSPA